jgi:hypothetical protein
VQVKGLLKEKNLVKLIDPDIQQNCIHAEVESLIQIVLLCTQHSPMDRPTIREVERMLEGKETWREMGEAAEASSSKCRPGPAPIQPTTATRSSFQD